MHVCMHTYIQTYYQHKYIHTYIHICNDLVCLLSDCANGTTDGSAVGSSFYCECGYELSDDLMTCVGM